MRYYSPEARERRRARREDNMASAEDPTRVNPSLEGEEAHDDHHHSSAMDTNDPTALVPINHEVETLVKNAAQMTGITDSGSLALAALQSHSPQDALMLLAASSAKASIEAQRSMATAQHSSNNAAEALATAQRSSSNAASAVVTAEMAEEATINSDYTYENRWKQQREVNLKINERLDRIESVLKRMVAMITHGADADQVADMMNGLGI